MSKTFFNIAEQKTNVIDFIKKHKDILCLDYDGNAITIEYLDKLKNANNADFFRHANNVRLKFGSKFYIFSDNYDEKHRMLAIWLPEVLSKFASDKAIKEFCCSKSFEDAIEDCYCHWYNMTPKRWETFEAVFDFYDKPKAAAKKAKKTAKKIVKQSEVKLSDSAILKDEVVF